MLNPMVRGPTKEGSYHVCVFEGYNKKYTIRGADSRFIEILTKTIIPSIAISTNTVEMPHWVAAFVFDTSGKLYVITIIQNGDMSPMIWFPFKDDKGGEQQITSDFHVLDTLAFLYKNGETELSKIKNEAIKRTLQGELNQPRYLDDKRFTLFTSRSEGTLFKKHIFYLTDIGKLFAKTILNNENFVSVNGGTVFEDKSRKLKIEVDIPEVLFGKEVKLVSVDIATVLEYSGKGINLYVDGRGSTVMGVTTNNEAIGSGYGKINGKVFIAEKQKWKPFGSIEFGFLPSTVVKNGDKIESHEIKITTQKDRTNQLIQSLQAQGIVKAGRVASKNDDSDKHKVDLTNVKLVEANKWYKEKYAGKPTPEEKAVLTPLINLTEVGEKIEKLLPE